MKRAAHGAVSAGLTSFGSAMYVRQRIGPRLEDLERHPEEMFDLRERLYKRGPVLLAGGIVTASATISSLELDRLERDLFGPEKHREVLHSVPYLSAGRKGIQKSLDTLERQIYTVCETLGIEDTEYVERVVEEAITLANYVVDGGYMGGLTHILGDLPTRGDTGIAALQALAPLSDHSVNFGWFTHKNPILNKFAFKAGLTLTAASWTMVGVYAVAPRRPKYMLRDAIQTARNQSMEDIRESFVSELITLPQEIAEAATRADADPTMDTSLPSFDRYDPE